MGQFGTGPSGRDNLPIIIEREQIEVPDVLTTVGEWADLLINRHSIDEEPDHIGPDWRQLAVVEGRIDR